MINVKNKKVLDVDLALLKKMSIDLSKKIEAKGYIPDHILYVERAGILVGYEMSKYFNRPVSGIISRRSGSSLKSKVKIILRMLPRFVTHFLRKLELKSSIHGINSNRRVVCRKPLPPKYKKILVVDDALDTGLSLEAVLSWLKSHGFASALIKTAVLTTTGEEPHIVADFSLLDKVICAFPWSYDSRQYKETKTRMAAISEQVSEVSGSDSIEYDHAVSASVGLTHS